MLNLHNLKEDFYKRYLSIYKTFFKWVVISSFIGAFIGLIGTLFYHSIHFLSGYRNENTWIIALLPIAGVLIVHIYLLLGYPDDKGTNLVLLAVRDNEKMSLKHTISIFIASSITHLFGGSSGREGAALQIGGSIGSQFGRLFKLDKYDSRIITMCGMSAAFAALFGTPVTAAFFAMEVACIGIFHYSALVPCVISSIIGWEISSHLNCHKMDLTVIVPNININTLTKVAVLSVLCAILSCIFCLTMKTTGNLYKKIQNRSLRAFIGGAIIAGLTFIIGTFQYNGSGEESILKAFVEQSEPQEFILKIIFTSLTLTAGFKGGEIVPSLFIGATFGSLFAGIVGMDYSIGAAIGMIAIFCGLTNCPIASMLLSLELFGSEGIVFYALACSISFMLSGYQRLYSEQKIFYSKVKTRMHKGRKSK